jgi:kynureninase
VRDDELRSIALAQAERLRLSRQGDPPELGALLAAAVTPEDVRDALLKERPVLDARRALKLGGPDPQEMREEAAAVGLIDATPSDLAFRRLFPGLDLGVYVANHSMGRPSVAWLPAIDEHLSQLPFHGTGAWMDGGWLAVIDAFRRNVAELMGADLVQGDVLSFPNFSEALSAFLSGVSGGRMVTEGGHFTTALYVHRLWAERTGATVVEVPVDALGCVPTERLVEAITPDTTVVSISHGLWRTGFLVDVEAVAEAMKARCPDAVLLLDVYQTLGTVPVEIARLPVRTAVIGGGIKQLHAGTGAAFAWASHMLLATIEPDRSGWWAHAEPMAFAPEMDWARGGGRFRTGTPSLVPMVALVTELRVLASSAQGDLRAAVHRARAITHGHVVEAIRYAEELGLDVSGPRHASRRAAFFAIRVPDGPKLLAALASDGIVADFRSDRPGVSHGLLRLSSSAASFAYELRYAVERVAHHLR